MPQPTPVMSPTMGLALLAIHTARQQGYSLHEIHQAASGAFTPAEDAEIEHNQIAAEGYVYAPASDVRSAIRAVITATLTQAA